MKSISIRFSRLSHGLGRVILLVAIFCLGACREQAARPEQVETEAAPTLIPELKLSDEQIAELQHEIAEGRQNIENLEAFVQMERDKLKENPDYEQSFMLEAMEEQQSIREKIESVEKSLQQTAPVKE